MIRARCKFLIKEKTLTTCEQYIPDLKLWKIYREERIQPFNMSQG